MAGSHLGLARAGVPETLFQRPIFLKNNRSPKGGREGPGQASEGKNLYSAHVVPELSSRMEGTTIAFFLFFALVVFC